MTQGRLGTWLESTGYLGQPGRRAPLLTCHLPKPCQNPLAPRPSAPESNVGQAMHTDQSPCEVWRSSLTRTHPQPCWAEACVWHGCVLLSLRSAVDPSGHSEHVREPFPYIRETTLSVLKRVLYQNSYEPESSGVAQQRAGSGLFLCRPLFATVPLCDISIWLPLDCSV